MAIDIKFNISSSGADKAKSDIKKVGEETRRVGKEAKDVKPAMEQGFDTGNVSPLVDTLTGIETKVDDIQEKAQVGVTLFSLGALAEAGAKLAEIGNQISEISEALKEVYLDGSRATEMLADMATKRGDGGRIEELTEWAEKLSYEAALVNDIGVKESAAGLYGFGLNADQIKDIMPGLIGQARLYGLSIESVASAFGKAFSSGNIGALRRTGVTIDQSTLDSINSITDAAEKQKAIFEAAKEAMAQYGLGMTEGMSEAEIAANRAANAQDAAMVKIGAGAAAVDAWGSGVKTWFMQLVSGSDATAKAFGGLLAVGGATFRIIGGGISMVAETSRAIVGAAEMWNMFKDALLSTQAATDAVSASNTAATMANVAAADASTAATNANLVTSATQTAVSDANTAASYANAAAADAQTISTDLNTASSFLNAEATEVQILATEADTVVTATNTATTELQTAATDANSASAVANAAATEAQAAATVTASNSMVLLSQTSLMAKLGIAAIAITAAATVGAVAYSIGQHLGWLDKETTYVENLKLGWASLLDMIFRTQNASKERTAVDYRIAKETIETQYAKDRQGGMSQEEAEKKRDAALLELSQKFSREANRTGDEANLRRWQADADRLEKATKAPAFTMPVMPAAPVLPAVPAAPAIPAATAVATAAAAAPTPTTQKPTRQEREVGEGIGGIMAQVIQRMGGGGGSNVPQPWPGWTKPYSTINSDGSVTNYPAVGDQQQAGGKVTLRPKTKVSQGSDGHWIVEILPEKFVIPNTFGAAVEAL